MWVSSRPSNIQSISQYISGPGLLCHMKIQAADTPSHLTQSQYTDTGPTSPGTFPIPPGAWQCQFENYWFDPTRKNLHGESWDGSQVCHKANGAVSGHSSFVCCLTSQQHAGVSQGRIYADNFTCCHNEIEVADQHFYLTQSQYTDTGPTSPSSDPI